MRRKPTQRCALIWRRPSPTCSSLWLTTSSLISFSTKSKLFLSLWLMRSRGNSPGSPRIGEIDTHFDHELLEIIRDGKGRTLADYSLERLLQAGDSEFLNWMVVLGTVDDTKAATTFYMPDHVATGWGFVSWKLT